MLQLGNCLLGNSGGPVSELYLIRNIELIKKNNICILGLIRVYVLNI